MTSGPRGPILTVPVGPRDHAQGPVTAPVTLVGYGDYQCADCGQAHPVVKSIQKRLGPRLRYVFRNFPLAESHPNAANAAEAAEAVGEQGKFWEMHDLLFDNQNALDVPNLIAHATRIGADPQKVAAALESHAHAERVREDFMSGVRSGVNGTPTFFINGARYDGEWFFPDLLAALEAASEIA